MTSIESLTETIVITNLDIVTAIACVAVFAGFILSAARLQLFWILCIFTDFMVALWWVRYDRSAGVFQLIVAVAGILLLGAGLSIVRVMAERSISLRLLRSLRDNKVSKENFETDIGSRLEDLENHGLAVCRDNSFVLTPFGKVVGASIQLLRSLTGTK